MKHSKKLLKLSVLFVSAMTSVSVCALNHINLKQGASTESEDQGKYGHAVTVADFNNDNYLDVVVGAPYNDTSSGTDSGWVELYWGGKHGAGRHGREYFTQNSISGASRSQGDKLGYALAHGDFDRDGYTDLAVSMPYKEVDGKAQAGMVAIMYGSKNGLIPARSEVIVQGDSVHASSEENDRFGFSLAGGDFNGDGYDDLAVGAPYEDVSSLKDTGSVTIFFGGSKGVHSGSSTENFTEVSVSDLTRAAGDRFGYRLAVGDFNTDGRDDLAVSAPYYDDRGVSNAGVVAIMHGTSKGLLPADERVLRAPGRKSSDLFGFSLATGNLNGDIYGDLIIGSPYRDIGSLSNAGRVLAYLGSENSLDDRFIFDERDVGGERKASSYFGYAVTLSDFDDDGFDDLAIGIPYDDSNLVSNAGAVGFIYGASNLVNNLRVTKETQNSMFDFTTADQKSDYFGRVLASGDVNRDGQADLVMGIPYEDLGSKTNAGRVVVHTPITAVDAKTADTAVVIDKETGKILAGYNMRQRHAMASTTKIMTALLTLEAIDRDVTSINSVVSISSKAVSQGGSSMGLKKGDKISVGDLLYGLMLPSGNDAAYALAEVVAGSEKDFLEMMNDRASRIGMKHTFFSTVHGRDPDSNNNKCDEDLVLDNGECSHYSTAEDMAQLARVAMRDSRFVTLAGTGDYTTTTWRQRRLGGIINGWESADRRLCTTNQFISTCGTPRNDFNGTSIDVTGIKGGSTDVAGLCLVTAARDNSTGREVISVVLGSSSVSSRYSDSAAVINFGFSEF